MTRGDQTSPDTSTWTTDNVYRFLYEQRESLWAPGRLQKFVEAASSLSGSKSLSVEPRLTGQEEKWLLALIAAAFVCDGHDGIQPRIGSKADVPVEDPKKEPAQTEEPSVLKFANAAECQQFFEFANKRAPKYRSCVESAKRTVAKKWPQQSATLPAELTPTIGFSTLIRMESAWLSQPGDTASFAVEAPGVVREPWVSQPARDYFGLCLSGGGIRSATFNLGLLQAFAEKGLLRYLHYVSTVSGGGYIGGFLSAWRYHLELDRNRNPERKERDETFPTRVTGPGVGERERPELRHLREFSRFLMPRVGFRHSETWIAIAAVLGGTLISLSIVSCAVAVLFFAWHACLSLIVGNGVPPFSNASPNPIIRAATFAVVTAILHVTSEYRAWKQGQLGDSSPGYGIGYGLATAGLCFIGWWFIPPLWKDESLRLASNSGSQPVCIGFLDALAPSVVWLASALALLIFHALVQRLITPMPRMASDRAVGRCLAGSVVATVLAIVWCVAGQLTEKQRWTATGSLGAAAAALFFWLRAWLAKPVEETHGSALLSATLKRLKPVLPQVSAIAAVVLYLLGVAAIVRHFEASVPALCAMAFVPLSSLFWFDPKFTGLHEFYRARIARCFLGAAQAKPPAPGKVALRAATAAQPEDDVTLGKLRDLWGKAPIHLVCCAANNLNGDALGSLYRGARSSAISPLGVSVGNFSSARDDLSFSSALTASAAAFNSQMGAISMKLGPAVAFIMCLLNLRLGLWVAHPSNAQTRLLFPALNFFFEALGMTRSDQLWDRNSRGNSQLVGAGRQLHLSDGGHFENLGLYELVRRHCRHIIVSDASADPNCTFDDLANAIRRVREDFGVEIEIDTSPLRKDERGFAKQHAVYGVIHFDGLDGTDKGAIIYFKPTLTGDEPVDILEFRERQRTFPHDSTGDQFYDEAQWESYRRLGQHSSAAIASLQIDDVQGRRSFVDQLFLSANQRFQTLDPTVQQKSLELTARSESMLGEIRDNAPAHLRREFFPESVSPSAITSDTPIVTAEERAQIAFYMMAIAQLMEDIWLAANLDDRWAHPLNEGWMSYFHRWTGTASFRSWWPILRPMFSPGFRDFVKERFQIRLNEDARAERGYGSRLHLRHFNPAEESKSPALQYWNRRKPSSGAPDLVYQLALEGARPGTHREPIAVGFLKYTQSDSDPSEVSWAASDFYVPPTLSGSGIHSRFLDAVLARFADANLTVRIEHTEAPDAPRTRSRSRAERSELARIVGFYKSRNFQYQTVRTHVDGKSVVETRLVRMRAGSADR